MIAPLPMIYTSTLETPYLGGILKHYVQVIRHQMPFHHLRILVLRKLPEHLPALAPAFHLAAKSFFQYRFQYPLKGYCSPAVGP
jgi:hypothetical protein